MKRILLILMFFSAGLIATAQNSTQGKEFWFSFMQNGYKENSGSWVETQVMISAKRACSGTVTNPRTSWSQPFTVGDESVVVLSIPEEQGYNEDNEGIPSDFGLLLTATDTVSVYTANCATFSFDASFVLPTESLGSNYIVQSDSQSKTNSAFFNQETGAFLIVAIEDNTVIDINTSVTTIDGHSAGTIYSVTLDRGQTYSMRSNNSSTNRDFSGTFIEAHDNKKIAVFNGNTLTTIPNTATNGHDHIFEQALPVETWGQEFVVTSSVSRTRDQVKVMAGSDNDTVWCNGQRLAVLSAGESYAFWLYSSISGNSGFSGGACHLETSQPSMVYLYNSTSHDPASLLQENGDPSMVWIPPVEQKIDEITFCTFNHAFAPIDAHYVNIVVDNTSVGEVYLDDNLIDENDFQPVGENGHYAYCKKEISHGIHHLSCAWGLIAHVYGFGQAKGYAYCVGANVLNLTGVLFANGELSAAYHDGLHLCAGESVDFQVRTSYPVQRVVWDFDGTPTPGGVTASHTYNLAGNFITKACIEGVEPYTNTPVFDTLTIAVQVGEAEFAEETHVACDEDSYEFYGVVYTQSGYYERIGQNAYGCDSIYRLTLDMDFTPNFEISGDHWPVGGSETYISVNEYAIALDDARATVDTVMWQIDCENWLLVPHGIGMTCTLYIYSYLEEPVMLHASVVNRCDTVTEDFAVKTTYFGTDENAENDGLTVSPNPTNGHLTLRLDGLAGRVEVGVYQSSGQRVDAFMVDAGASNVYDYTLPDECNGLYLLVLRNNGTTWVRKVPVIR